MSRPSFDYHQIIRFMGDYWHILLVVGAAISFFMNFKNVPDAVAEIHQQHVGQLEMLRQIRCSTLYDTYKEKLTCIETGR